MTDRPRSVEDRPDDDLREAAIDYAFDTLEPEARARFEARSESDAGLRAVVAEARELADGLGTLVPDAHPPPGVLGRVRARLATERARADIQPWKSWRAHEPLKRGILSRDASAFEPTGIEGIEVRRLALDEAADRVTLEIRMAPGTSYPAHRHGGAEECYVLEGDIDVGGVQMTAGDFQRQEAGSVHPVQSTQAGCRLLVVSSLHDELV